MNKGRKLAYLLRHDTSYVFDKYGWREVQDLVVNHGFSMEELCTIVATDNKQRYEFSEDSQYIRACQGHSVDVDVELEDKEPPEFLYHGTTITNLPSIMKDGICNMNRLYVHLSVDEATALQIGGRRSGAVVVLRVSAQKMHNDGYRFWLSRNNIWLTEWVPTKYITPNEDISRDCDGKKNG